MNRNLEIALTRASELFSDLEKEYESSLQAQSVSARAEQLTHEVAERLRSALDRTARCYWDQKVAASLSKNDRERANIYFPIADDQNSFDSIMGRWRWANVKATHQPVIDFLQARQPFVNSANKWLATLNDLAIAGKHIDLVPQIKSVERRTTVTNQSGASVSWGSGVRFGSGVSVAGAPIDPTTQRIVPTPGVTETVTDWVSFMIGVHNVNALGFCKQAVADTRKTIEAMCGDFGLS